MRTFWVSYDLLKQKDYQRLFNRLESLGAKRALLSLWVLKGNFTFSAKDLVDDLRQHGVDPDDRLVVIESRDWASIRALTTPNQL
jgi:hypothetical protein